MPNLPSTPRELADYIVRNADKIHVKTEVYGRYDLYRLSDMPPTLAMKLALDWIVDGVIPPLRISEEELRRGEDEVSRSSSIQMNG